VVLQCGKIEIVQFDWYLQVNRAMREPCWDWRDGVIKLLWV